MRQSGRSSAVLLCLALAGCYGLDEGLIAKLGSFTVSPISGTTSEAGGGATFSVVLNRLPSADVTVGLSSSNPAEGVPGVPSLTFTAANWNVPQIVAVTGVDDSVDDGTVAYSIVLAPAVSADYHYSGINPADVAASNTDDDTAGVTVTPTSGLFTSENLTTATFDVVLDTQPAADVTIDLASSDTDEGTVSAPSLTFTAANWNVPQTVTVTGVNDLVPTVEVGGTAYTILTGPVTSADPLYSGIAVADVSVTNNDNDSPGVTVTPTSGLQTSETGAAAQFTVVLNTQPSADVVIDVTTSNSGEGLVHTGAGAPATSFQLTFTNGNWDTAQTVTVTGVNDPLPVVDGDVAYSVTLAVDAGATLDNTYDAVAVADPAVTNLDDDDAGFIVTPTDLDTVENGGDVTFTVALASIPSASVTITVASSNTAEGTVGPAMLTFLADATALDPQTVTVSPVDDGVSESPVVYAIQLGADAGTADADYLNLDPEDVSVTNDDDDTPGLTISPLTVSTSESGTTANIGVVLGSIPAAQVTVTITGLDGSEGSLSDTVLTFDPNASALVQQTVVVTGLDDIDLDSNVLYTLTFTPTSTDPDYNTLAAVDVGVTNIDNDTTPPGAAPGPGVSAMTPTAPTAYDDKRVVEPSVIQTGASAFTMWFEGSNGTGQKHEQVGLATSVTLPPTTWVKDAASPVLTHSGDNAAIDKAGVGDPSVLLVAPGDYRMWFACRQNAAHKSKIAYATSTDGVAWTKHQLSGETVAVLSGTAAAFDSAGVASPHVILDGATYKMWYQGIDASGVWRIGYATSSDGLAWTKNGSPGATAVLPLGAGGAFDDGGVMMPCVIKDVATYRMWYIGRDNSNASGVQRLGYAQSVDGITWVKFSGNPILDVGAPGSFSERNLWSPWVVKDGTTYRIWYGAEDSGGLVRIAYTFSN